jgi:hypothetical protein
VQLGQQLGDIAGACAHVAPDDVRGGRPQIGPQRLHPWPVRGRTRILPSASPQDLAPALACTCRELVRQPALADPRLAAEQDQSTAAETRLGEVLQQFTELALAPHERSTCVGLDHRSLSSLCASGIRAVITDSDQDVAQTVHPFRHRRPDLPLPFRRFARS